MDFALFRGARLNRPRWATPELHACQRRVGQLERELAQKDAVNRVLARQAETAQAEYSAVLVDLAEARRHRTELLAYARSRGLAKLPEELRALLEEDGLSE